MKNYLVFYDGRLQVATFNATQRVVFMEDFWEYLKSWVPSGGMEAIITSSARFRKVSIPRFRIPIPIQKDLYL